MSLRKIVSGGQTGVDRAALDAALAASFPCGGWCPKGRLAEDGRIDDRYPLRETGSRNYTERTERNVAESDGTFILAVGNLRGGTALTKSLANRYGRPCLVIDLESNDVNNDDKVKTVTDWIERNAIEVLNVAGPRESQQSGIQERATVFLRAVLRRKPRRRGRAMRNE